MAVEQALTRSATLETVVAAVIDSGATLVVGGEAIWPPFLEADSFGAGAAAEELTVLPT